MSSQRKKQKSGRTLFSSHWVKGWPALTGVAIGVGLTLAAQWGLVQLNPGVQPVLVSNDIWRDLYPEGERTDDTSRPGHPPLLGDLASLNGWMNMAWFAPGANAPVTSLDNYHGRLVGFHNWPQDASLNRVRNHLDAPDIELWVHGGQLKQINAGFITKTDDPILRVVVRDGNVRQVIRMGYADELTTRYVTDLFEFDQAGRLSYESSLIGLYMREPWPDAGTADENRRIVRRQYWHNPEGKYLGITTLMDGRRVRTERLVDEHRLRSDWHAPDGTVYSTYYTNENEW